MVSFPVSSTTYGPQTGETTTEGDEEFGDPFVFLTKRIQGLQCIGACANGVFPNRDYSRLMTCTIEWDAYDVYGNNYADSFTGPEPYFPGSWFLQRWVDIPDFDYGEFWAYVYEDGVLMDSDYEYYTKSLSGGNE